MALIEYFMEGLKPSILDKVYALEKIPTDITRWYTQASQIDNQWHQVQEIKARNRGINLPKRQNHMTPRYMDTNINTQDPNAMDVDWGMNQSLQKKIMFQLPPTWTYWERMPQ